MRQERRATEVRQVELTDAALRLVANKGIAALSTRTLAAEVGLTTGAIFRHFASLDALLEAVVARVEDLVESTYPAPDLPPLERLERFVVARSAAVGGRLGILRLVLSEQFHLALPKNGSARLSECVQKTRSFLVGCLRAGQRSGEVRADLSAETLAPIVMGTVHMLALSQSKPRQREGEVRAVLASLMALLRSSTAGPRSKRKSKSNAELVTTTRSPGRRHP